MKDPLKPRPNILWRLFVMGGMGTTIAVSVNDDAWEAFDDVTGGSVERDTMRLTMLGLVGLHVIEAIAAFFMAKGAGLPKPRKWATSTLLWGFPVHRRIVKARRHLKSLED